jgi:exonuclease SbcD
MDFKFLHAADIHLDSPLRGLSKYEGVPADIVRTATRGALDNLVTCALDEQVAFVIIAGDLYDGDWEAFATGLYFCAAMGRLHQAGIEVFLVYGNHDAESHLTHQLPLPQNVKVFSAKRPETFEHLGTGTVLHGQSYKAKDPGGDLAIAYPSARSGALNIGVLHTALIGDRGHAPYAPCHPDQLAAKGYDYWALGHVHGFEIVRTEPHIVFPGNLQGRNIRETGPKGAALVSVVEGRLTDVAHIALDVVRWALVDVDVSNAVTDSDLHDGIRSGLARALEAETGGRPLIVRVRLTGETPLHDAVTEQRNAWREAARAIAASLSDVLWIEKVALATAPPNRKEALDDEFEALLTELSSDPATEAAIAGDIADFLIKAPAELDSELELIGAARAGQLGTIVQDAAAALRARLTTATRA